MLTLQDIAEVARQSFVQEEHSFDRIHYALAGDAPQFVRDLVYAAHENGQIALNDWIHEETYLALEYIIDNDADRDAGEDFAYAQVDIYNNDLIEWFASSRYAVDMCDDVLSEHVEGSILAVISRAQYNALTALYGTVCDHLQDELGRQNDE